MRDVLAALQQLQEQDHSHAVTAGSKCYAIWFVSGTRKLYHWLWEEVEEGFFIVSKSAPSTENLQPLHISRTLCTELPTIFTCAEQGAAEVHEWESELTRIEPIPDLLEARKLLSAITELQLRLEYPIFVAVPGKQHAGGQSNDPGVAFLGLRTLIPGDENLRPNVFAHGLHVLETFDVSKPQTLPYSNCYLPTLLGASEQDEVEVSARFELVSVHPSGSLRWNRGPFCCLDLTFTSQPEGQLFPLRYPGNWEANVYVRGESEDDLAWPHIRLLKYILSKQNQLTSSTSAAAAALSPQLKRARITGEAAPQQQVGNDKGDPQGAEAASDSGRIIGGEPTFRINSARDPLVYLDMDTFLSSAAFHDDDFVDLLWHFLAKHLAFATAATASELKSTMNRASSRNAASDVNGTNASMLSLGVNDSFLFPSGADSPTGNLFASALEVDGGGSPGEDHEKQEEAWRKAQEMSDADKCGGVVSTLRVALRAVFQHLNSAGMPYIRKNNESELARMVSEYLVCFTRERRYGANEREQAQEAERALQERREQKRRFFERLQFLERPGPESDLAVLRLFADAAIEAGREECRRYRRNLGFEVDDSFRLERTSNTPRTSEAQYLWLRSQFHIASLADISTRAGVPWEATSRLVRKATAYYDVHLDRCRNLPVFSLPLSRVAATKLVGKCVPYVRPCFVRVAGRNRVVRLIKERFRVSLLEDHDMDADGGENVEETEKEDHYSVTHIDIRKFVDDSEEDTAVGSSGGRG
ncbi:unnamed protein product [Amoebophrya sp. A120]|nr:unnamed protein product [Amoebophrya sp. A120]|eukprot:GSA120T00021656001.1